jgi:hypothetical protein
VKVLGSFALCEKTMAQRLASELLEHPKERAEHVMLIDLARRLRALGMRASLGYHGKLGLVAAHGARAITVETDVALQGASLGGGAELAVSAAARVPPLDGGWSGGDDRSLPRRPWWGVGGNPSELVQSFPG